MLTLIITLTLIWLATIPIRPILFTHTSTVTPVAQTLITGFLIAVTLLVIASMFGPNVRFPQI